MNEYEENNIDWYEEEIVNESRVEKSANIIGSQLTRAFEHIAKYKVDPKKQSDSWRDSILSANIEIEKELKRRGDGVTNVLNKITPEFLDAKYEEGIKNAIKLGKGRYKREDFPKHRDDDFTLEFVRDKNRINNFLERYKSNETIYPRRK